MFVDNSDFEKHIEVLGSLGLGHYLNYDRQELLEYYKFLLKNHSEMDFVSFEDLILCCPENIGKPYPFSSIDFSVRCLRQLEFEEYPSILEVNSGTGAILLSIARYLGPGKYIGIENNIDAVKACAFNSKYNDISVSFIMGHLFEHLRDFNFNHIIFNLPFNSQMPEEDCENGTFIDPYKTLLEEFLKIVQQRFKPNTNVYIPISNLTDLSPFYNLRQNIQSIGAESFNTGFVHSMVKMVL